jgi:hypothetical protein
MIFMHSVLKRKKSEQRTTRSDELANTSGSVTSQTSQGQPTRTSAGLKAVRAPEGGPEGRGQISFGTTKRYVALPDIGADDNTIPNALLKELDAAGRFVARRTLENPIIVELAVKGPGMSAVLREQAQLTVELHLSAGPLRLRNARWLVPENDMDEVLLGRPLLRALGLDAPAHLQAVRDSYKDLDCSKIVTAHDRGF